MTEIHKQIKEAIDSATKVLIVSHLDPDGDSIGSQIATLKYIRSLGKQADAVIDGIIPRKYSFFPGLDNVVTIDDYKGDNNYDLIIYLECPSRDRIGRVAELIKIPARVINIDHHPDNSGYGDIVYVDAKAAAVAEILTRYFIEIDYTIDKDTATLLYSAILTDTGRFRFDSTTRETMEIAGFLIEAGAAPREICDHIYYSLPESILKLTAKVLSRVELFEGGKICLIALDKKSINGDKINPSDTEGMAEFTLYGERVIVGGFLKEIRDDYTKISLRSRDSIDVSKLAHRFGGGGHYNAAGFTVEMPIHEAREMLLNELKELVSVKA